MFLFDLSTLNYHTIKHNGITLIFDLSTLNYHTIKHNGITLIFVSYTSQV